MIHLGIIGCGWVVSYAHVKALQRLTDIVKVVALADPSPGRNELVGEELGVPPSHWYADYSEMIEQEELDGVDLALPHFLHESITIDCVQHGLHIFSDKPLATNLQSADRILKAVEQARRWRCAAGPGISQYLHGGGVDGLAGRERERTRGHLCYQLRG